AVEKERGEGEQSAGKKFPGTREKGAGLGHGSCRSGDESGASDVGSGSYNKECAGSFLAGLPRGGKKPLHSEGGEQQNGSSVRPTIQPMGTCVRTTAPERRRS